jgi:sigma-B regulation protein RsbU (phosphoserine phosphatase)
MVEDIADQLRRAVDGHFDFAVQAQSRDESIDKLAAHVNSVLESAHKSLVNLSDAHLRLLQLFTISVKQYQTVQLLKEIGLDLSSILNLDELFTRIAEALKKVVDYSTFSILIADGRVLRHRFSLSAGKVIYGKPDVAFGRGLVGSAAEKREPVVVADVHADPRYIQLHSETRSEMSVPLIYKGEVIGVLDIEHTNPDHFRQGDVETISSFAAQLAVAISNALLYDRLSRHERRLQQDLAAAQQLQKKLLPRNVPRLKNSEVSAFFLPARTVSGDFFDFIHYPKRGVYAGVLADVSGKGAAAAIYAALASGIVRSWAEDELEPRLMLSVLNDQLLSRGVREQYVAMAYSTWDDEQRLLETCNSGLPVPLLCRGGSVDPIRAYGVPLGLLEKSEYDQHQVPCQPGDTVLFYTDGVVEAFDRSGNEFGVERLCQVLTQSCRLHPDQIVANVMQAIRDHSGHELLSDDAALIALSVR